MPSQSKRVANRLARLNTTNPNNIYFAFLLLLKQGNVIDTQPSPLCKEIHVPRPKKLRQWRHILQALTDHTQWPTFPSEFKATVEEELDQLYSDGLQLEDKLEEQPTTLKDQLE